MKKPKNPIPALKRAFSRLYDRATGYVRGVGRQTDEILASEPIDFSAPSIEKYNVKISRPALGLPAGANLSFADSATIAAALRGRVDI